MAVGPPPPPNDRQGITLKQRLLNNAERMDELASVLKANMHTAHKAAEEFRNAADQVDG